MLGSVGKLPDIYTELEVNFFLLRRLLGVKTDDKKQTKVTKLTRGEVLMVNIGSTSTGGKVLATKGDLCMLALIMPSCTDIGEKVALSRRIDKHWRLVGAFAFRFRHLIRKANNLVTGWGSVVSRSGSSCSSYSLLCRCRARFKRFKTASTIAFLAFGCKAAPIHGHLDRAAAWTNWQLRLLVPGSESTCALAHLVFPLLSFLPWLDLHR